MQNVHERVKLKDFSINKIKHEIGNNSLTSKLVIKTYYELNTNIKCSRFE